MRRAQPWTTDRARVLRSASTSAEERLWGELRARRLAGFKFVRQCPIGPYFVDFVCRKAMVVVEIDGGTHGTPAEMANDEVREAHLRQQGYRVFRVHNVEVFDNLDGVCETLLAFMRGEV